MKVKLLCASHEKGMEIKLRSFLSSALDGVTGQPYAPDGFIQRIVAPVTFEKRQLELQRQCGRCWRTDKSLLPAWVQTPDRLACSLDLLSTTLSRFPS
jgi:hypothetical protein